MTSGPPELSAVLRRAKIGYWLPVDDVLHDGDDYSGIYNPEDDET
jgi:hypothetical protein